MLYRRAEAVAVAGLAEAVASREDADPERVAARSITSTCRNSPPVWWSPTERGLVRLADRSDDRFLRSLTSAAADEGRPLRRASASATLSEF